MIQAEADLLRTVAQMTHDVEQTFVKLRDAKAPEAVVVAAAENTLQANQLLDIAILRWLTSL
jgi:hypothetical protein